ncbi:hypothetical protein HDU98_004580 [Podochytrium sp. JEL0797]|nr:hypothetical protein HDU98_004580 [Podochytrium sp. JEL0797]
MTSPRLAPFPLPSFWLCDLPSDKLRRPPSSQRDFDVVVVGGGLSGFATALHLSQLSPRLRVAVLDARGVAGGASGRNGGLVRPGVSGSCRALSEQFGTEEAKRLFDFENENVKALREFCAAFLAKGGSPDPLLKDFEHGGIKGLTVDDILNDIQQDWQDWCNIGCFPDASLLSQDEVSSLTGYRNSRYTAHGALHFKELRVHSARLVLAIAQTALENPNVCFFPKCLVSQVSRIPLPNASHAFHITTPLGRFTSTQLIYATNAWTSALVPSLLITPVRNQVIATHPVTNPFWSRGTFAMILNAGFEYMSGRGDGRVVLGGMRYLSQDADVGCDRDDALNATVSAALRAYLARNFEGFEGSSVPVEMEWSGICGYTQDNVPMVGSLKHIEGCVRGEFVVAGFCGHGMTRCFLAGRAVAEMVVGVEVFAGFPKSFAPRMRKSWEGEVHEEKESSESKSLGDTEKLDLGPILVDSPKSIHSRGFTDLILLFIGILAFLTYFHLCLK